MYGLEGEDWALRKCGCFLEIRKRQKSKVAHGIFDNYERHFTRIHQFTLLLLLFNLARRLWILYSGKRDRWDDPCEYSTWIIVVVLDLVLKVSLKFFVSWVGHCLASIFSESVSSKFLVCPWERNNLLLKISIRMARGLSAICLLIIFLVVTHGVLVIQHFIERAWKCSIFRPGGFSSWTIRHGLYQR